MTSAQKSGCGEWTSVQWGGGYSNWCDMCLGLGLIAGLSAIAAGFSLLRCGCYPLISQTLVSEQVWQLFHPLFLINSIQEWNQLRWDWIQTGSDEVSQLCPFWQSKTGFPVFKIIDFGVQSLFYSLFWGQPVASMYQPKSQNFWLAELITVLL